MGEVWRAYDLKLRVDVALKTLRAELLEKERALEALRQEVRSAREVVSPNVCRVFDLVELDGQELVSMEYIDGTTLIKILHSRGPLELQEAREIASQFLAGLEAIHQAGLVHRDLKPENIMITRSGRVVVMDFGIAKGLADRKTGTVSGTPAYMAPEQARGEEVDARADVFSAGVVLAEMIAPNGTQSHTDREAIWHAIHKEPPVLPDMPWTPVLKKAVARLAEQRYPSASALARALEEVALQVDGAEDVRPYPGLASFTEEDAEYFFGRELEVEAMWKKLRRPHLLGLIGPSGAGKSSFLRAGLLPVMPEGWRAVICQPGTTPFQNLARALLTEFTGDMKAMEELLSIEKPDVALSIFKRWRQQHTEVLLIVDQFEELFTLNPPEGQSAFAELLGSLTTESDVRVLLAMRDDFLFHCHLHRALSPIFSELTPLGPPVGGALRRALVQPALKCGYRFEEENLVEEMITEVSEERGALPLLAFAAAQLWEHRDRERGLLTREAHDRIGGVGGALAKHAEATLEKIGNDRVPIVREIFRNLVTAQGTRAARDMEELLSVFNNKDAAREVLRELIDARLLTSFEVASEEEGKASCHQVEIIHESLLSAWPRLVRWQTQDADSAQLRDQLRQAAQLWQERGRPADLLWTGTSFNEFKVWRERYPGGLTTTEEAFSGAMIRHAERRKRRRRLVATAAFVTLLGVVGVVGSMWQQAVAETRRAEASKLRALAQLELEERPSAAIAYALASLELNDNPEVRRFVLEALWKGPTELWISDERYSTLDFSHDGKLLALGHPNNGQSVVLPLDGGNPVVLESKFRASWVTFGPRSDFLVTREFQLDDNAVDVWSIPEGRLLNRIEFTDPRERPVMSFPTVDGRMILQTHHEDWISSYSISKDKDEPQFLGRLPVQKIRNEPWALAYSVEPSGTWLAYVIDRSVYVSPLEDLEKGQRKLIGRHDRPIWSVTFHPDGDRLASVDVSGEIRIWSLARGNGSPLRVIETADENIRKVRFEPAGSRLVTEFNTTGISAMWDLEGPPDADPIFLQRRTGGWQMTTDFHPGGNWIATGRYGAVTYPLSRSYPKVLRGHRSRIQGLVFAPNGDWIASTSINGDLIQWPLSPEAGDRRRVLLEVERLVRLDTDPGGQLIIAAARTPLLVSLRDGSARELVGLGIRGYDVVFGPQGRRIATGAGEIGSLIRVRNLETGQDKDLDAGKDRKILQIEFTPEGHLLSSTNQGELLLWNVDSGDYQVLLKKSVHRFAIGDDGHTLLAGFNGRASVYDLEEGTQRELSSHGSRINCLALDRTGRIVVTGDRNGLIRVGPITGEEPHLLLGHEGGVRAVRVSPKGDCIASGGADHTIRVWPVPNMDQPPFHTLPYEEFLERLRSLTNLRAVPDEESSTGYRIIIGSFPGWEVPVW
jgi:WD40 repeat protein